MRYISVVLMLALLAGCGSGNKKKNEKAGANAQSSQQNPDAFERGEDPPLNANTRYAAGQLAESMGDFNKAAMQYREAIKLDPKHRDAMFRLGSMLTQQRQYPEAVGVWQRYIELTNHAPAAYNNLAYTYEAAGQSDQAEATYRQCIERDPSQQACRLNYGRMLARYNRIDDAVAQFSTVLRPAEVSYNLGTVFEQQRKLEQARAYYRKALEQDPNLTDAKARLAALDASK
jgi:tetratricopeptide (TPR) repeat protein